MTGVQLPAADFLKLAHDRIPNLAGVKFTFENLMDFAECIRMQDGRFDVVFGPKYHIKTTILHPNAFCKIH